MSTHPTDRPDRAQVVAGLAEWSRLTRQLATERALHAVTKGDREGLIAENMALRARLAASLERERAAREHRRYDAWGAAVALWWALRGRMTR